MLRYLYNITTYKLCVQNATNAWMDLHGSEWTPFVDAFFSQQRAETQ